MFQLELQSLGDHLPQKAYSEFQIHAMLAGRCTISLVDNRLAQSVYAISKGLAVYVNLNK